MALVPLLGNTVQNHQGGSVPVSGISKGVVGIYFSAHWCPPCRGFTPQLAEFYNNFKAAHPDQFFEIIFVSSDRTAEDFKGYFADMPWLALAFEDREKKEELSTKYSVRGIPTLVLIDGATGQTITTDGRGKVMQDPQGKGFPWK